MTLELKEEIESAVEYQRTQLSPAIRELISRANHDLYHGPSYYDASDDLVTCFDEGAKAFPFSSSCAEIRDALADIGDLSVETSYDEESGKSEYETVDGTRKEIVRGLVGKELVSYVL